MKIISVKHFKSTNLTPKAQNLIHLACFKAVIEHNNFRFMYLIMILNQEKKIYGIEYNTKEIHYTL